MKRVVRIQCEGKVKDIGLQELGRYPKVKQMNTTVAPIQAFPHINGDRYLFPRATRVGAESNPIWLRESAGRAVAR